MDPRVPRFKVADGNRPFGRTGSGQLTGAAINLARIDAHLTDTPRARTRTSHFAALRPVEQLLDGAK